MEVSFVPCKHLFIFICFVEEVGDGFRKHGISEYCCASSVSLWTSINELSYIIRLA